jgi:hypothetical protein
LGPGSVYTSPITSRSTIGGDGRYVLAHPFSPCWIEADIIHYENLPRQISRLYRPLSGSNSSLALESDEEDEFGTQLLPLHNKPETPPSAQFPQNKKKGKGRARPSNLALADVWDEREELFGVGDADEDDEEDMNGDEGEERTVPPPPVLVREERQDTLRDPKPAKSVRWAEGSA